MSLRFLMNPKVDVIEKKLHSFLDLLRDFGGLAFMLIVLASIGNFFFTYNKLENALVEQLYMKPATWKIKDDSQLSGHRMLTVEGDKTFKPKK